MFRALRADEIECRIGTVKQPENGKKGGISLLLYKTARVDQDILDETVGPMNWQKSYSRDNRNCTVSIWDEAKGQWISKEDTGTESQTEVEKGLASDSFKRACFNWGIGRELYTAPFIWISGATKWDRFWVKEMEVEEKKITSLVICACDQWGGRTDEVAFKYPRTKAETKKQREEMKKEDKSSLSLDEKIDIVHRRALVAEIQKAGVPFDMIKERFGVTSSEDVTYQMEHEIIAMLPELAKEIA